MPRGRPRYCNRVTPGPQAGAQSPSEAPPGPLADLSFALVGPGRVGTSLASWLVARGARQAIVAGKTARLGELSTAGDGLLLIAVPDGELPAVAAALAARRQAPVALHTAGALPAAVLSPLAALGTAIGSLHPLKAFPRALPEVDEAAGVVFGIDGDPPAQVLARRITDAWAARAVPVPPESRALYHFAATLAAGGVVTVLSLACELAGRLELPEPVAEGYLALARGALGSTEARAPQASITGPLARGDAAAVESGFAALTRAAPDLVPAALALAHATLGQVRRNPRAPATYQEVGQTLERLASERRPSPRE